MRRRTCHLHRHLPSDRNNGAWRGANDVIGRRSKEQPIDGATPVNAQDDEVNVAFPRRSQYFVVRLARRENHVGLTPGPRVMR